jgi:flagellar hook-associated protein 2
MPSIDGLISGINTDSIINGLISMQNRKVETLKLRRSGFQVKQQALQGVEARLLSFRAKLSQLNRSSNSVFQTRQIQSSQENLLTATASNQAIEGSYTLRVMSLAQAHQIGSNGFQSTTEEITTGTISIQVGNRPLTQITIDNTNNSVTGLVEAINTQSQDVSATIIRDQASGTDRILLTSKHTGAANEIQIVNNMATVAGVTRPDFSGPALQVASNAVIQFGSGAGAITTEYSTNKVEGLIQGVTLNVKAANPTQDITVTVSRDINQAQQAIRDFVDEYNSLVSYINDQSRYNAETQQASPLLGNRNVSDLKNRLLAMVTETIPGISSGLNRLSQLGLSIDSNGKLNLDNTKLTKALNGELAGVSSTDIERLFGLTGTSTNANITFFAGSTRTVASANPIQIDIIQAAEQASVLSSYDFTSDTVDIDSSNNTFQITIDGIQSEVLTLQVGTYSKSQLAQQLQSVINASSQLGNREVSVSSEGDRFKITSLSYGSASKVSDFTGSAGVFLGFSGSEQGVGKDVAGNFIVNGVVEAAVGTGRILVGNSNNATTADLQVRVTLTPQQVSAGIDAELTITRGATSRLDKILNDFLDTEKGTLSTINKSFDARIESINQSIERINKITESKRESLIKQFAALERTLSSLQTTASIVSSQLAVIQQR